MLTVELKETIKNNCLEIIQEKITILNNALNSAIEATNSETKSTVGDKHETGRAMMQLEQEKLSRQLSELNDQKNDLLKINTSTTSKKVIKGSLIETQQALIFVGSGLGKLQIEKNIVFAISESSPLGKLLMGQTINNSIELNKVTYTIKNLI